MDNAHPPLPTASDPWRVLSEGAATLGVPLTPAQLRAFQDYTALLLATNQQFNLTAVRDLDGVIAKLHLDSLSLLAPIAHAAGLSADDLRVQPWRAVDVGAGAGIPGLPFLLVWPALHLTLIESVRKKGVFLKDTLAKLGRTGLVLIERAEIVGRDAAHRERYDLVLARAVAELPTLVELTLPLARVGGLIALPKGPKAAQELQAAGAAIAQLGGEIIDLLELATPGVAEARTLVLLRKRQSTPAAYPRAPGLPAKRPLQ